MTCEAPEAPVASVLRGYLSGRGREHPLQRGIMSNSSQAEIAKKTWELSNNVMEIQPGEEIYRYDKNQQQSIQAAKPWEKDPHFFKASFEPTLKS